MNQVEARSILTRCSGYLRTVTSHSLNPYVGCSLGRTLCGVGCYVQHNHFLTRGRAWGRFLEGKANAAELYLREAPGAPFSVFMSSSTEPFPPQEKKAGITLGVLKAMAVKPPSLLIVQTHSALVADYAERLCALPRVRVHISIESDREDFPGLPRPAYSVERRLEAGRVLSAAGFETVACLSPLLPLRDPAGFMQRLQTGFGAVIVDHFVGGDGSAGGRRTRRTRLPEAMESGRPGSTLLDYRDEVVELARHYFPGRVGVGPDGFAGRYLK
ncbi:MAG: hypothetical protein KF760_04170 [Candidatus Eremiobacteraeota bacterium]|nr:hypothetical protein [Candidatus Eremiobacteraeota bacterium]